MYQALYRKYRPQLFSDVVGQEHITATLKNECSQNRLSHAYLFTGSHGTGKTTCAKILAKAVNCQSLADGDPCNECDSCRSIDSGANFDVLEIDAASNNGVDTIRDLRDGANFTPSNGKYRVYIIDEVHMLSMSAFNALLKTLEEPPEHVKFILATTEVHKLPATILSRCQRFDFKRIKSTDIAARVQFVANAEGLEITDSAAMLIAQVADGAMRNALSILDQCASRSSQIDEHIVSEAAALAGRSHLFAVASAVAVKDVTKALNLLDELYNNSCDMSQLCSELINHYRNYMIAKTVKNSRELIICTDEEFAQIKSEAAQQPLERLIYILELLQATAIKLKSGAKSRIEMEMLLIKLCDSQLESGTAALLERIETLESALRSGSVPKSAAASTPVRAVKEPVKNSAVNDSEMQPPAREETCQPEPQPATTPPVQEKAQNQPMLEWPQVLERITKTSIPLSGILNGSRAFLRGDYLLIDSTNAALYGFIKTKIHHDAIMQAIKDVTGQSYRLGVLKQNSSEQPVKSSPLDDLLKRAGENGVTINEN